MAGPTYQATGTQVAGTGTVSPPWPASHAVNDIALLFVETANEAVTLSDPQGFVEIANYGTGTAAAAGSTRLTVFWCRATSTSMTAPTVADPGDHVVARISTYRGCITNANPWDTYTGDSLDTADTAVTIPALTTTVANTLLVLAVANGIDSAASQMSGWANTTTGTPTEVFDANSNNGVGGGVAWARIDWAVSGDTGATTGTLAASSKQARMAIALRGVNPASPTPGLGALTTAGLAPTARLPRVAGAGLGLLVAVGFAPTIRSPRLVTPGTGVLAATGFVPAIRTPVAVSSGVGPLIATGLAPTILLPKIVRPGRGVLSVTGFAPKAPIGTIRPPGTGALAATGFPSTILTPRMVRPGAGAVVVTGHAVVIQTPVRITASAGALSVTGFAPIITTPRTARPAAGAVTTNGFAATILTPRTARPELCTLLAIGFAPVALTPVTVASGVGTLAATGVAPFIAVSVRLMLRGAVRSEPRLRGTSLSEPRLRGTPDW